MKHKICNKKICDRTETQRLFSASFGFEHPLGYGNLEVSEDGQYADYCLRIKRVDVCRQPGFVPSTVNLEFFIDDEVITIPLNDFEVAVPKKKGDKKKSSCGCSHEGFSRTYQSIGRIDFNSAYLVLLQFVGHAAFVINPQPEPVLSGPLKPHLLPQQGVPTTAVGFLVPAKYIKHD